LPGGFEPPTFGYAPTQIISPSLSLNHLTIRCYAVFHPVPTYSVPQLFHDLFHKRAADIESHLLQNRVFTGPLEITGRLTADISFLFWDT
jgi:hypothetical protein